MIHLDLFSGIGGFSLAADWTWGEVQHIFCEIDPFCQKVLKKHWPDAKIFTDIKELTYEQILADTKRPRRHSREVQTGNKPEALRRRKTNSPLQSDKNKHGNKKEIQSTVDLLTGGFPCQPFSVAGKRQGEEDDRYLWPEMLRVILEVKPRWIIGENVAGSESIFKYDLSSELEGKRYKTEKEARADFDGVSRREGRGVLYMVMEDLRKLGYDVETVIVPACAVGARHRRDRVWIVANSNSDGFTNETSSISGRNVAEGDKISHRRGQQQASGLCRSIKPGNDYWGSEPNVGRVAHGVPQRVDRLKGLGNAIVPQVAQTIMQAIKQIEAT